MQYVLEDAILDIYRNHGWNLQTSNNPYLSGKLYENDKDTLTPDLQDLYEQIEVVLARKAYGQEIHQNLGAALRSRMQSLMRGNKGEVLNTQRAIPFDRLFDEPAVIELQNLGDDEEKAFIMALLFVFLYEYAEVRVRTTSASSPQQLKHLTLIEEAHRLLQNTQGVVSAEIGDPRAKAVNMFTDMLAEMRAYGEGFLIADQIPTKLTPETLKNTNTKILHRLIAPDDRQMAGSCCNLDEEQTRHLNNLAPGMAVVHNEHIGEPVLVRISPVKDRQKQPGVLLQIPQGATTSPDEKEYLYRHAGCSSCPSVCDFYNWGNEITEKEILIPQLQIFFEDLLLGLPEQAWAHWRNWRRDWLSSDLASTFTNQQTLQGVTYCSILLHLRNWSAHMLIQRRNITTDKLELTPKDRLLNERILAATSGLILQWIKQHDLDVHAHHLFIQTQQHLHSLLKKPIKELPGCRMCPARCLLLPFISPIVNKINISHLETPGKDRLEIIRLKAAREIPQMKERTDPRTNAFLYCLLTQVRFHQELEQEREDLLKSPLISYLPDPLE